MGAVPSFLHDPKAIPKLPRENDNGLNGGPTTSATMRIAQLQRPIVAATSGISRAPSTTIRQLRDVFGQLRIGANNAAVEGRRNAAVKSQGAYKLRDSSTIPKKLGAKKSGGTFWIYPLLCLSPISIFD